MDVQRDSARQGFEISALNKMVFISDKRIRKQPYLMYLIKLFAIPHNVYWTLWRATHKKEIEENKRKLEEFINRYKNA
jgi:hypothetical protein